MIEIYHEKKKELEVKRDKLLKQREKINTSIKRIDAQIKDYDDLIKIQSFDAAVTVLKEHGMSIDDLLKKIASGDIK